MPVTSCGKPAVELLPDRSIAVVLGTRPEIVKLAGVIEGLGQKARVIHTGQHYDTSMSKVFFGVLGLPSPDVVLGVGRQRRAGQIATALHALDDQFAADRPVAVVVQGDTNATLSGALAGNAHGIPVVHVEAGLRSYDRNMPEEHNRVLTDHVSDLLCAATEGNVDNLAREGIVGDTIVVTGNTVIEAVHRQLPPRDTRLRLLDSYRLRSNRFVLATIHLPENTDDPAVLRAILTELHHIPLPVLLPLHPRTAAAIRRHELGDLLDDLVVINPMGSNGFLALAQEAAVLVSDSGGLQEECTVLKRPLIVVRRSTERPESLRDFAVLVEPGKMISKTAVAWLNDLDRLHAHMARTPSPYGDGRASDHIVTEIVRRFAPL